MSGVQGLILNQELRKKILFTIMILIVYRIGVHIPTPGVDGNQVMKFFAAQSTGIFSFFNTFTGGALERFSIFALGIMPYISSSIIFQLLTSVVPSLEALKKEGTQGQKKITQYTRYATVLLAVVQGYGISVFLKNTPSPDGSPLVYSSVVGAIPFEWMTIITLTAGTCFIMWLGEQITERGIGNGSSLIIFSGIVSTIPSGAIKLFNLVSTNQMVLLMALGVVAFIVAVIGFIIYIETAQRRIQVQYSQRAMGPQGSLSTPSSYLPMKINPSGVIPPIFASSLISFPSMVAQYTDIPWLISMRDALSYGGTLFNLVFVGLIVFFCFFYSEISFNYKDIAENLKKHGGFIPGIRAGQNTSEYLFKLLQRLNVPGSIYLSAICVLPSVLQSKAGIPFYFGGTTILIAVGVAIDTTQQIQSYLISQQYESFLKGKKIRGRRVQY